MKILFATETYYPYVCGSTVFTHVLAEGMVKKGHTVAIAAPSETLRYRQEKNGRLKIYRLRSLPIGLYQNKLRFAPALLNQKKLRKIFRTFKPDIVHAQHHFFVGRGAIRHARKNNIPVIATNHFVPDNLFHAYTRHLPKRIQNWIHRIAWNDFRSVYNHANLVTAPTKTAADIIRKQRLHKPVVSISCGIDLRQFHPGIMKKKIRETYALPDVPLLLYVGRLDPEKKLDTIIRGMPKILKKKKVHAVIVGTGGMVQEKFRLKKLIRSLGLGRHITLTGFVSQDHLPELYRGTTLFVMPGIAELQSIATMEAMASGLPVVAANALALPELVHHGKNGFLFRKNDPKDFAKKTIQILSRHRLRKKMARESLQIIRRHALKHTVAAYENLYRELYKKSRNGHGL